MDMSQYLDLFLEEAAEHVQTLNQNLLKLEHNPERIDLLDEIFRAAHTLKGMSATMGYDSIAGLTHKMENLFDMLRERKISLDAKVFNCLFKSADALDGMLEGIREGETEPVNVDKIVKELGMLENGSFEIGSEAVQDDETNKNTEQWDELNEYEQNLVKTAVEKGFYVWRMFIEIHPECLMKGVRAFMIFKSLEGRGEIIKSVPAVQDIEDENFDSSLVLYYISADSEESIRKEMNKISEIKVENIDKISAKKEVLNNNTENDNRNSNINGSNNNKKERNKPEGIVDISGKKQKIHQTVRVDINRLDSLMSLVGELVINKTRLEQINASNKIEDLNETIERINSITGDLQTVVQNARMVAIEQVFNRFPRMVRDLAKDLGKEVELIVEGKETELDRTVIDEIGDPLVHLLRNALDHGLESTQDRIATGKNSCGVLQLKAKQEGNHVIISVEDDGRGIELDSIIDKAVENGLAARTELESMDERELLSIIFEPGFSTSQEITDLSGRGVGLDVVKNKIQSLSGDVYVTTKKGKGTKFTIKLPLTLAIIQALLVRSGKEVYAIPLANIDETTSLEEQDIKNVQSQQVILLRGSVLPLVDLKKALSVPGSTKENELYVVVVRKGEQQIGLVVDELIGQQEIVINSLGRHLSGIPGIAGASILGDGKVSLILDIATLI